MPWSRLLFAGTYITAGPGGAKQSGAEGEEVDVVLGLKKV